MAVGGECFSGYLVQAVQIAQGCKLKVNSPFVQGILVGNMAEHRRTVNQLAVSGNGAFLASASNDETVKVWDCRRLDRDVSFRSKLTYASQGESWSEPPCCHTSIAFCALGRLEHPMIGLASPYQSGKRHLLLQEAHMCILRERAVT